MRGSGATWRDAAYIPARAFGGRGLKRDRRDTRQVWTRFALSLSKARTGTFAPASSSILLNRESIMFNPTTFVNSRPDGIGVLEITGESGDQPNQPGLFVPLNRTELCGEITGPLASLRLTQIYGYSKEQCDKTLEAVYRFPLPGDAAVTCVRVSFGEVEIVAELKERGQAETDYEEAVRTGRQTALATRESPDVFTLRVAGIQSDQEIKVETHYVQLARAEGAGWSLRIPLTTAPRYVRGDELASRHAQGQPLALLHDPGHRFALDIIVRGASTVESRTHELATSEENGAVRVRLRE